MDCLNEVGSVFIVFEVVGTNFIVDVGIVLLFLFCQQPVERGLLVVVLVIVLFLTESDEIVSSIAIDSEA